MKAVTAKAQLQNPFQSASEFWEGPDEVEWLIPDLIPRGSLSLVAGRPKAGKTLLALNLAAALSTGGSFLGRLCPPSQVGVVQLEDPESLIRSRLKRMVSVPPEGLYLSVGIPWTKEMRAGLYNFVALHGLDLLILDPLVLWKPGTRENNAEEMASLMYGLRRVVQLTSCSLLVVHHSRKGGGENGDSIRGSSAILGAVDVALELVKEEEGRAHLRVISRFGAVEDEALELEPETMTWRSLGPARQIEGERRRAKIQEVLKEMEEASAQELLEVLEVPKRTLYRDLNALEAEGSIASREAAGGRGKPCRRYFVPRGKAVVAQNHIPSELRRCPEEPILCQRATPYIGGDLAQNPELAEQPVLVGNLEALEGREWVEEVL